MRRGPQRKNERRIEVDPFDGQRLQSPRFAMTQDAGPHPRPDSSRQASYLLRDAGLGSPLEELRAVFEKKLRTAQNLGENDKVRTFQEAYDLARKRLGVALGMEPEKV